MALLDDEELLPFFGNPNIQRQGARARALAAQRDVNTLPDPRTYAAVSGLLGTAPDQMGFSVLNPDYQDIQRIAKPAFALGTLLGLAPLTKGLPVGASIKNVGGKLKVKPPTDDIYEVMDATFDYGKLGGNKNLPIDKLIGGVRMSDPAEVKRVKELAAKISGDNGYISRIIVDDKGNVLEGQHRLEALRLLGEKNVPVAIIEDLSNKYNIPAMKKSLEGQLRSDNVNQMVKRAIDAIEESGSVDKALTDFAMPAQFQKPFQDALRASMKMPPAPQQAALDLAQQRAALPVEQGGLGLRAGNTAEQRAKAMGFDMETYHGTNAPDIRSIDVNKSRSDVQYMPGFFTADNPNLAQNYGDIVMPLLQKKGTTILDRRAARQSGQEVPMLDTVYDKEKGILVTNNPENIRSRFAAFDPFRRSAAVAATMGAAAPDLLAAQQDEEMRKLQQLGLLGMVAP